MYDDTVPLLLPDVHVDLWYNQDMYFKHFLKMVIGFSLIIGLGILGLFAINMYQKDKTAETILPATGTMQGR